MILAVSISLVLTGTVAVVVIRKHFYASRSKDLRLLANVDFELAQELKNLKVDLEDRNKPWPLRTAVNT